MLQILYACMQVPPTSSRESNGKFQREVQERKAAADKRIAARKQELQAMLEEGDGVGPFSFYKVDMERQRAKEARQEAHRRDKNRFQV
jgi:hypothetical protein